MARRGVGLRGRVGGLAVPRPPAAIPENPPAAGYPLPKPLPGRTLPTPPSEPGLSGRMGRGGGAALKGMMARSWMMGLGVLCVRVLREARRRYVYRLVLGW